MSIGWASGAAMIRRKFIAFVGGMAGWPLIARAQQADRIRRIGALTAQNRDDPELKARLAAFVHELQRLGWNEDRNVQIDLRGSGGDASTTRRYATELVVLKPDVILGMGSLPVASLLELTHTVPIVFTLARSGRCWARR
jgi:putative ABC transport system substrate-binding protein